MNYLAGLAAAVLACAAVPAWAQTESEFEKVVTAIAGPCIGADAVNDPAGAATVCAKLNADIEIVRQAAGGTLSGHDANVYHVVKGMTHTRLARSSLGPDKVRSAQTCEHTELAWTNFAQINAAASPAYKEMITKLVGETVKTVATCRGEFGAPTNAAPLPG